MTPETAQPEILHPNVALFQGDCLDIMPMLPDKSVDMIFTSPPYNLGNNHHTSTKKHNPYNDDMPETEYQLWQIKVLNEYYRILKDDGSLFYNHKNRIKKGFTITPYEWLLQTKFKVKQEIVWINGSPNMDKCRFYPFTERIYWLSKVAKTNFVNVLSHHDVFNSGEWKPSGTNCTHTRGFPVQMCQDIFKCFPQGGIVLDSFAGSGTTGIAAINTDRAAILIEKEANYCDIIRNRITNHIRPVTAVSETAVQNA